MFATLSHSRLRLAGLPAALVLLAGGTPHRPAEEAAPAAAHAPAPSPHAHRAHWGYAGGAGPDHWADLSADYSLCRAGHMQSPVDLGGAPVAQGFSVRASYRPAPLAVLNNGHTVQVEVPAGSTLSSGIARYKLLQVHFHTPSEETVYGVHYPMVAHFVHVDHAGNLAVLAVLFEEGAPNAELQKLVRALPASEGPAHAVEGVAFDPSRLLPASLAVWRYEGSLTTPPCSEGVRWHVLRTPVTASAAQIAAIHAVIGDNARPTQPLHGRMVVVGAD